MDPLVEIRRLRHLALLSMWVSGVVTLAYFGTLIYMAVKASKNRELLRRYPRSTRWKIFTRLGDDWEALVEPAHREPLRRNRRCTRYALMALLVYLTVNGGAKALRAHWLAQAGELIREPSPSDRGQR